MIGRSWQLLISYSNIYLVYDMTVRCMHGLFLRGVTSHALAVAISLLDPSISLGYLLFLSLNAHG